MSNKPFDKLNELDQLLRKQVHLGPNEIQGTVITIELLHGFELFNTRPYHNYENWSTGYRVSGRGISVEKEDLDDAINAWIDAGRKVLNEQ